MSIRINGGPEVDSQTNVKSPLEHGAWHMAADPSWYEPQRTNTFEFVATGLEGMTKQGMEKGSTGSTVDSMLGNRTAQEALRLSVNQANIPSFQQSVLEVNRGNTMLKYAGKPTFNSGSIQVQDYIGLPTLEVLYAWQALSFNVLTEKVGTASDYKKTCYLMEYGPGYQLVRRWKLIGCWISEVGEGSFDWSSDGLHQVTATIQYDKAMIDRDDI